MFKEQSILPLISQIKAIFDMEIVDFALLNEQGYRYTHAEFFTENSFKVIEQVNLLRNDSLPYIEFSLNDYQCVIFNDLKKSYLCIAFDEKKLSKTSLDAIYERLLKVSFFNTHLEIGSSKDKYRDFALLSFDFSKTLKVTNKFAAEVFGVQAKTLEDFKDVFEDYDHFKELYQEALIGEKPEISNLKTKSGKHFIVNTFVDQTAEIIQFIFAYTPVTSFYENILDSFDYLKLGIVHLALVFDETDTPIDAKILYANNQYGKLMDTTPNDVIGKTVYELYPDFPKKRFERYANVGLKGMFLSFEDYADNVKKFFHIYSYSPRQNEFINVYYDTTYYHKQQAKERSQLRKMQMMLTLAEMGFFEINLKAQTFEGDEYVKKIFEQDHLDFQAYRDFFRESIHPEDKVDIYHKNHLLMTGQIKEGSSLLRMIMPKTEQTKYIEYYLQTIEKDDDNKPIKILGLVRDVTETQEARKQIDYLATHDSLSGVHNRHHLYQLVNKKQFDYPIKIAILDLDGLKTVNDVFGHYEGDRVIKRFAKILREVYHDQYIARIGGDEFVILFTNGIKNPKTREKLVREQLKKILDVNIPLDVSIGYEDLKDKNSSFHETFTRAEEEMYRHKLLARPKRKARILRVLMQYMFAKDKKLKERIDRLDKYATALMKQHGYMRKDEEAFLKQAIYYHSIGQVMDFVHQVNHTEKSKRHEILNVEAGFKILSNLLDKEVVCKTVLYQCEQFNGRGYPHRLKGKDIPFLSRVLAIVYHYDQLIEEKKLNKFEAIDQLMKNSPRLFDPNLVQTFIYVLNKQ